MQPSVDPVDDLRRGRIGGRLLSASTAMIAGFVFFCAALAFFYVDIDFSPPQRPPRLVTVEEARRESHEPIQRPKGGPKVPSGRTVPGLVAVGFAVMEDDPDYESMAMLMRSMQMTSPKVSIEYIALVHWAAHVDVQQIKSLGYKVYMVDQPIYSAEIKFGSGLQKAIDTAGTYGAAELIKLHAYQLTRYESVLLVHWRSLFVQNIDNILLTKEPAHFVYDVDNKAAGTKIATYQQDFLLVRPNKGTYEKLVGLLRGGDFGEGGWLESGVGYTWAGPGTPGLISYFYSFKDRAHGELALDECEYNYQKYGTCKRYKAWERVKTVNMRDCPRPDRCPEESDIAKLEFCRPALDYWWGVREDLDKAMGLPHAGRCCVSGCKDERYTGLDLEAAARALQGGGEGQGAAGAAAGAAAEAGAGNGAAEALAGNE